MSTLKRLTGAGIILLASVVLILCFAGIVGVWVAKNRVDLVADRAFEAAEDSLAFVDEKLDRIEKLIQNSHRRIGLLSKPLNRLAEKDAEIQAEATSLLKALHEEVYEPLKTAQTWLDSTRAVAVGVCKISDAVAESDYAASHPDSVTVALAGRLEEASAAVVEILARLEEVRQGLIELRDNVLSARRIALTIIARVADVEERLARLSGRIEMTHDRVSDMKSAVVTARDNSLWWTMFVAAAATASLTWFAVSQIGMVLHGWSLAAWNKTKGNP